MRPPIADTPLTIQNNNALALWLTMAVLVTGFGIGTGVLIRLGPHPAAPAWLQFGAVVLFWIGALALAARVLKVPLTRLVIRPDGHASLTQRTPLGRTVEAFPPGTIARVEIRHERDGDGDDVWTLWIVARDGRRRKVRAGFAEAEQRRLADRLRLALGLA